MKLRDHLLLSFATIFILVVLGIWLAMIAYNGHLRTGIESLLLALAASLVLLTAIWLAFALARLISQPLENLATATRAIAAGRFDVRVGYSLLAEANTLAANFNEMAETLEAYSSTSIDRLLAEQRRSEVVLTSIDDGLIIFDDSARIERINPTAARQLGISVEEGLGHTIDELLRTDGFDHRVRECIERQQGALENEFNLGDVSPRAGRELTCVLSPFQEPTRPGLVMVLRDVTAKRRFARLRMEFVLHASHELRTPVAGLRMGLALLAEQVRFDADSREADLVATVLQESERLGRLVDDLLDLSRLDQTGSALNLEVCDVDELLESARQRFVFQAREAQIEIDCRVTQDSTQLHADPSLLSRVLDNLLANALRHTPAGGLIHLGAQPHTTAIELSVTDNGSGIALNEIGRVFEPFSQFGEHAGGAGLGLTLCREIVERHGGRIEVDSTPGQGARFSVYLPWPSERLAPTCRHS